MESRTLDWYTYLWSRHRPLLNRTLLLFKRVTVSLRASSDEVLPSFYEEISSSPLPLSTTGRNLFLALAEAISLIFKRLFLLCMWRNQYGGSVGWEARELDPQEL